jgi:hypothetical protein
MRRSPHSSPTRSKFVPRLITSSLALCAAVFVPAVAAQRHNGLSSPPTAPPPKGSAKSQTIVPVSSGLGALQIVLVDYGVPAPQSLTRQLQADDDRTRIAALSALGTPGQYLQRGHVPFPHSIQLDLIPLGLTDDLDAIVTIELDQHLVSSILVPEGDSWHRIATVTYATAFNDPRTTPATFLRVARSLMQHERSRAIYRATQSSPSGDFTENEAHIRVLNNKVVTLISYVSRARTCNANPKRPGCDLVHRWMQPDVADPTQRFLLVSATGHLSPHEAADPLAASVEFQQSNLHTFACQPYVFSETTQRYEPTANSGPCPIAATPTH